MAIRTRPVGRGGRLVEHYRFRTMTGQLLRKPRFGRLIGNLILDDLPTLWNVIRGDICQTGPRPELREKVDLGDPGWQQILTVRPGLSGLDALTFLDRYNQTSIKDRIQPDGYYALYYSWRLDLALLVRTLFRLLHMGHLKGRF